MKPLIARIAAHLPLIVGSFLIGYELGFTVGMGIYVIADVFFEALAWPEIKKSFRKEWK